MPGKTFTVDVNPAVLRWARDSAGLDTATVASRLQQPEVELNAWEAGKLAEAIKWHYKLFALCKDMLGIATNPIPIKTAMKMLGRDTGELRLPMCAIDAASDAKLRATLAAYGLL